MADTGHRGTLPLAMDAKQAVTHITVKRGFFLPCKNIQRNILVTMEKHLGKKQLIQLYLQTLLTISCMILA